MVGGRPRGWHSGRDPFCNGCYGAHFAPKHTCGSCGKEKAPACWWTPEQVEAAPGGLRLREGAELRDGKHPFCKSCYRAHVAPPRAPGRKKKTAQEMKADPIGEKTRNLLSHRTLLMTLCLKRYQQADVFRFKAV